MAAIWTRRSLRLFPLRAYIRGPVPSAAFGQYANARDDLYLVRWRRSSTWPCWCLDVLSATSQANTARTGQRQEVLINPKHNIIIPGPCWWKAPATFLFLILVRNWNVLYLPLTLKVPAFILTIKPKILHTLFYSTDLRQCLILLISWTTARKCPISPSNPFSFIQFIILALFLRYRLVLFPSE